MGGDVPLFRPPYPFWPFSAPQAKLQKTSHPCVLLLQGGGLYEWNYVSDRILMTPLGMGDFLDVSDMILTAFFHMFALFFIFS